MASRSASRTVELWVTPSADSGGGALGCGAASFCTGTGCSICGTGAGATFSTCSPLPLVRLAGCTLPPSSVSSAIGVFTATPSVPSLTRIFCSTPSSTASTSMVALSVSISASTSPEATLSPSFFSHRASLPSVMVGDSAGMRISMAIGSGLHEHVGVELRRIRLRTLLRELGGFRDDVADLLVDLLQPRLVDVAALEQQ